MSEVTPYDLQRCMDAQESVWEVAARELRAGRKATHWMWFMFPQIQGLGSSVMATRYAMSSLEEARAYLEDPVLGFRLLECTRLVNEIHDRTIEEIFGYPDHLKFHSSITLFAQAMPSNTLFAAALQKHFGGQPDPGTIKQLSIVG